MHTEEKQRAWEEHLIIETEAVDRLPRQRDLAWHALVRNRLLEMRPVRDAPTDVLVLKARRVVKESAATGAVAEECSGIADGLVFDELEPLGPGRGVTDVRVHVNYEIIVEAAL